MTNYAHSFLSLAVALIRFWVTRWITASD